MSAYFAYKKNCMLQKENQKKADKDDQRGNNLSASDYDSASDDESDSDEEILMHPVQVCCTLGQYMSLRR